LIAEHITSWDVLDGASNGEKPAEVNVDNARGIPREIAEEMVNIICTWHASGGPDKAAGN